MMTPKFFKLIFLKKTGQPQEVCRSILKLTELAAPLGIFEGLSLPISIITYLICHIYHISFIYKFFGRLGYFFFYNSLHAHYDEFVQTFQLMHNHALACWE